MLHSKTSQDLKRIESMLTDLRKFKQDLLSLEVGDMVWDAETKEWLLVLKVETNRIDDFKLITSLEISSNSEVCFTSGERYYSFKKGGKVVKGTST